MEVRSYRNVFALERRLYSIDRLQLNPGGVPVRSLVYMAALSSCAISLSHLPGVGALASLLPWYLRDLALPCAAALALGAIRMDGRPVHVVGASRCAAGSASDDQKASRWVRRTSGGATHQSCSCPTGPMRRSGG